MEIVEPWYRIDDIDLIDSPALVIYTDRVKQNIDTIVSMIDDASRLRPHIKTHKTREIVTLCMEAGISRFKCATIAEAELLGLCQAPDVLLAYQLTMPKLERFLALISHYTKSKFSCLVDNLPSAIQISEKAVAAGIVITVFLDLDVGMHRTGIKPGREAIEIFKACKSLKGINMTGFHAYDGHIHAPDMFVRSEQCQAAFQPVEDMRQLLVSEGYDQPELIAGGSPCFPIHAKRSNVECSPGTFVFWDKGYQDLFPEQNFLPAALVISRVISLPGDTTVCLDLGHKAVAAENNLQHRVFFLNAPDFVFLSQSEEHLLVDAGEGHNWKIGDVLFGLPVHICPTCALYESATIIQDAGILESWDIVARDRKLFI